MHAQGFAALVSPPRFELSAKPGKTLRSIIEVTNRSTAPGRYRIHTADWKYAPDFSVTFQDELQPDSCRPWVSIERPEVEVPGGATLRYRFEVAVPADAPAGECRFAVMIEGADPSITVANGVNVPVTGTHRRHRLCHGRRWRAGSRIPRPEGRHAQRPAVARPARSQRRHGSRPHERLPDRHRREGHLARFRPTDFPILPHEERDVFLTPSTDTDDHPTLTFPVTVKGTLEWAGHKTEFDQRFE